MELSVITFLLLLEKSKTDSINGTMTTQFLNSHHYYLEKKFKSNRYAYHDTVQNDTAESTVVTTQIL